MHYLAGKIKIKETLNYLTLLELDFFNFFFKWVFRFWRINKVNSLIPQLGQSQTYELLQLKLFFVFLVLFIYVILDSNKVVKKKKNQENHW